jgi:prevent-host-death family protein
MTARYRYGLEEARASLPLIVSEAAAGSRTLITRYGKPRAAVVPLADVDELAALKRRSQGILGLRGSGRGLWGENAVQVIAALRGEWGKI